MTARPLETNSLSCTFGDQILFKNLDFRIGAGEVVLLKGGNGSGKSTFLRAISRRQKAMGKVELFGESLQAMSLWRREELAPVVDQDPVLDLDVPAVDNLIDSISVGRGLKHWFLTTRGDIASC